MGKNYIFENYPHMLHGGDYNPDQWLDRPDIIEEDMRLMNLAGANGVSVGIFAWDMLEPEENVFDFEWLDKLLDRLYENGQRVMLATPSGAKPAWLAEKYPETRRTDRVGVQNWIGERHNHCPSSKIYKEKVKIIDTKLAERYGKHPAVLGWHISNEFGGECYCPLCAEAFRRWLKNKYGTLENLNACWWAGFWSHRFTSWSQIDPPSPRGDMSLMGRIVDWKRFNTENQADFLNAEIDTLKSVSPDLPVTTNLMGFYDVFDYRVFSKKLDFISWDSYPAWRGDEKDIMVAVRSAMDDDLMRSLKPDKPYLIMECAPSHVNWHEYNKLKRPGAHMLASMQSVAHGSDSVMYFQWRKGRGGSEKFHGAVVDHEGSENTRVFREVSEVGKRLKGLDEIVGTRTKSDVAILFDWDNRWALEASQGFQQANKKQLETTLAFYDKLWERGINVDIIGQYDDFSRYSLVLAPMRYMVSEKLGKKMAEYVENGGTLLSTYTLAMADENDLCYLGGFPGAGLKKVFGIWNEEIDTLYPDDQNTVKLSDGTVVKAVDYCERIHPQGAEVLAYYDSDFYKGEPAATRNKYGKGTAWYVAFRDTGDYTDRLVGELIEQAGVKSCFDGTLPYGVTAHSRTDDVYDYVFLENYSEKPQKLSTKLLWQDAESKAELTGEFTLGKWETRILKIKTD